MDRPALVGEGECGAGELAGSWVFGGGGEFGLREAGFVVPEWGALGQRPTDEGHRGTLTWATGRSVPRSRPMVGASVS